MIESKSNNPYENLALEEYLLSLPKENEYILYLWQNQKTVVIGRNQNCFRECNIKALKNDGCHLARRLSGGGAVFHDKGNLNFTFIMSKENFDLQKQLKVILQAVRSFGIDAIFHGRNDLLVNGKKFSGNAFYKSNHSSYHHGTLLVNSDVSLLERYLNVSKDKLKTKGVASVKSRVINLVDINPKINVPDLKKSLIQNFEDIYEGNAKEINFSDVDKKKLDALTFKYSSENWLFNEKIEASLELSDRFSWGSVQIFFSLSHKKITDCKIYSDAMETEWIPEMEQLFVSQDFSSKNLCLILDKLPFDKKIDDIKKLLCSQTF